MGPDLYSLLVESALTDQCFEQQKTFIQTHLIYFHSLKSVASHFYHIFGPLYPLIFRCVFRIFSIETLHLLARFISHNAPRNYLQTQLQFKATPGLRNVECLGQARVTVVAQHLTNGNTHCLGSSVAVWSPQRPSVPISVLAKLIPGNISKYFSNGKVREVVLKHFRANGGSQNGLISVPGTSDLFIKF